MNIRQQLINKTRETFNEPILVDLSEKQYHSHCIFYVKKRKLNFNKNFLKYNKNRLDKIIQEVRNIVEKTDESIIYINLSNPEGAQE